MNRVVLRYAGKGRIPRHEIQDTEVAVFEKFWDNRDKILDGFEGKSKLSNYCIAVVNRICCELVSVYKFGKILKWSCVCLESAKYLPSGRQARLSKFLKSRSLLFVNDCFKNENNAVVGVFLQKLITNNSRFVLGKIGRDNFARDNGEKSASQEDKLSEIAERKTGSVFQAEQDSFAKEKTESRPSMNTPDFDRNEEKESAPPTSVNKHGYNETGQLLANYQPNENLEKLIFRTQSGLRASDRIDVLTPATISTDGSEIVLEWTNKAKEQLIVEVLDNKGERVFKKEMTGHQYRLTLVRNGLYYWKLISEDFDLLFCGRIVVQ